MADRNVPLTNAPQQSFTTTLPVDGNQLILGMSVRFDEMCQYWLLSISDSSGNPLLANVPLLCGDYPTANILAQHSYLQIGSAYVLNVSGTSDENPGANSWSGDFQLMWSDTAI